MPSLVNASPFSSWVRFMSISRRYFALGAAFALTLLEAGAAYAHDTYPSSLASELPMPCVPQCTICHKDNLGGFGTINKAFGKAMQADGLSYLPFTLDTAIAKMKTAPVDSDGDGVTDLDELMAGTDPNDASAVDLCGQTAAKYGCGAHIATIPERDGSAPIAALLTAVVLGAAAHRSVRRKRERRSR